MSYRFDKTEVPQFTPAQGISPEVRINLIRPCVACGEESHWDADTGLCRPCWRVVILGPAMANQD